MRKLNNNGDRTKAVLSYFFTPKQVNYGINKILIRAIFKLNLVQRSFIHKLNHTKMYETKVQDFLPENYLQENVNYRKFIFNYLSAMCDGFQETDLITKFPDAEDEARAWKARDTKLRNKLYEVLHPARYRLLGCAKAFSEIINIENGHDDLNDFQNKYHHTLTEFIAQPSAKGAEVIFNNFNDFRLKQQISSVLSFPNWPVNQIDGLPLFVAEGFEEDVLFLGADENQLLKGRHHEAGFFFELIRNSENQHNISHIVAIGFPHDEYTGLIADFPKYFAQKREYSVEERTVGGMVKGVLRISPIASSTHSDNIDEYVFKIERIINERVESTKEFKVTNIKTLDGEPIVLTDEELVYVMDKHIDALLKQEGVFIHCYAGLGRSGQYAAMLYTAFKHKLDKFFTFTNTEEGEVNETHFGKYLTEFAQKIEDIVNQLRLFKPGLILEDTQLYQYVVHSYRYAYQKYLRNVQQVNEALVSNNKAEPLGKRKEEHDVPQEKSAQKRKMHQQQNTGLARDNAENLAKCVNIIVSGLGQFSQNNANNDNVSSQSEGLQQG